jgi:hypothetical protein
MSDSDRRRERAARLLAMALKARETGQSQYADELTKLASDVLAEAAPIEDNSIPRPQTEPQQPAQQQQQPQPKKNGK